jgi:hypothetical protein
MLVAVTGHRPNKLWGMIYHIQNTINFFSICIDG